MGFARFEPGTRGPWPAKEYDRLVRCMGQVINSLALLSGAYGGMDRKWARRLAENADTLHPSFVSPRSPPYITSIGPRDLFGIAWHVTPNLCED